MPAHDTKSNHNHATRAIPKNAHNYIPWKKLKDYGHVQANNAKMICSEKKTIRTTGQ